MKNIVCISFFVLFSFLISSCKNDKTTPEKNPLTEQQEEAKALEVKKMQEEAIERKAQASSVMSKLMITPETKTFTSSVITVSLSDMLLKEEGPFTVFAPSVSAFEKMDEKTKEILTDATLRTFLERTIRTHIVEGKIDSIALTQHIRNGNGTYKMTTVAGDTLVASKKGMDIVLKDKNGVKAVLFKSDIVGSNGVVHVLDNVLGLEQ